MKRRNEKGDFRKVQREQAIRAAKEAAKAKAKTKSKAPKSKGAKQPKNVVPKNQSTSVATTPLLLAAWAR